MSALHPEGGYPRLIRFVNPGALPSSEIVSMLDRAQNLLRIDAYNFKRLNPMQQHIVLHTEDAVIEIGERFPIRR